MVGRIFQNTLLQDLSPLWLPHLSRSLSATGSDRAVADLEVSEQCSTTCSEETWPRPHSTTVKRTALAACTILLQVQGRNLRTVTSTVHCHLTSHRRSAHIKYISSIMYPPILKRETFRFPKRNLKFLRHRSFHFIVLFLWNFLPVSLKFSYSGCNLNLSSRLSSVDRPHKPR